MKGVGAGNPSEMAALDADARLKAAATWEAAIKWVTDEMFADVEIKLNDQATVGRCWLNR
jgi:hypothetical protein